MTITIPLFALRHGRTSGLEYAIFNLMRGLHASGGDLRIAFAKPAHLSPTIWEWITTSGVPASRYPSFGKRMSARFAEETAFAVLARAERVIFPNYHLPFAAPRIQQRSVFLHDVQHKVFPHFFSRRKVRWLDFAMKHTLARADRILFISEFECEQAKRFYGDHFAERARVVHVAMDWERFERGQAAENCRPRRERPFILSVSQHYPHKRLDLLIRAFGLFAQRQRDFDLVLVGRPSSGLADEALAELPADVATRIQFTGFVSDAELGQLYRQASLFALPSVYEGFGMPAVEAMGFGTPALLVDATAVPEATMGFARYLPATAGPADWAVEMEDMVESPSVIADDQVRTLRRRYDPVAVANRVRLALDH